MSNINELTAKLKAAAAKALLEEGYTWWDESQLLQEDGVSLHPADAAFVAEASPENVLTLIEALESAERQNGYLREQRDEWERKAISNFEDCSEMAARIAELEARTLTVKLPQDEDWQPFGFAKWANSKLPASVGTMTISHCEDAWRAAFDVFAAAAGMQIEGE